jgi:hypothetical protein
MSKEIRADWSDLKLLERLLDEAQRAVHVDAARIVQRVGRQVEREAKQTASSYQGTGELASSLRQFTYLADPTGATLRVGAAVRQAFFLEYGSPTTGAPRPWLSGPAERGQEDILIDLAREAKLW